MYIPEISTRAQKLSNSNLKSDFKKLIADNVVKGKTKSKCDMINGELNCASEKGHILFPLQEPLKAGQVSREELKLAGKEAAGYCKMAINKKTTDFWSGFWKPVRLFVANSGGDLDVILKMKADIDRNSATWSKDTLATKWNELNMYVTSCSWAEGGIDIWDVVPSWRSNPGQ